MRNKLLAPLLLVAACSAERAVPAPAQGSLPPESLTLSVRGTQRTEKSPASTRRTPIASSTSSTGPVWIETTCQNTPVEAQVVAFKREYPTTTAVDLGKAALLVDRGTRQQLTAWDTDSNCRVDVTGPKDVDTVAIARTLLSQLAS